MKNMITNAAGALGAWTLTRRVTRHVPRIFMFHRFSSKPSDGMTDADELVRFIDRVRAVCELVTVSDLASRLDDPRPMARPLAAITVDDGYADFHTVALPILAERGVPATLYATAGFVDGRYWLWWDALRHLLEVHPGGTLELELDGQVVAWQLGDAPSRQDAWERIADTLVSRNAERATVISELQAAASHRLPTKPTLEYAPMSWAQLAEAEAAGIEIGGHTMTHAFLPGLDHDGLRQEINAAKALMEEHLTHPLVTFAYPNGNPSDCTPAVIDAVRAAGFSAAVLAHPRPFRAADRYRLGRWSAHSGEQRLDHILNGASALKLALRPGTMQ
jgi:peptidoglycan/xylan/chitin deacetylase (PgdA/CDA1 family)